MNAPSVAVEPQNCALNVVFFECNVANSTAVKSLIDSIEEQFAGFDIAFNNVGIDIESDKLADGTAAEVVAAVLYFCSDSAKLNKG